jgi:hypothetical protein
MSVTVIKKWAFGAFLALTLVIAFWCIHLSKQLLCCPLSSRCRWITGAWTPLSVSRTRSSISALLLTFRSFFMPLLNRRNILDSRGTARQLIVGTRVSPSPASLRTCCSAMTAASPGQYSAARVPQPTFGLLGLACNRECWGICSQTKRTAAGQEPRDGPNPARWYQQHVVYEALSHPRIFPTIFLRAGRVRPKNEGMKRMLTDPSRELERLRWERLRRELCETRKSAENLLRRLTRGARQKKNRRTHNLILIHGKG